MGGQRIAVQYNKTLWFPGTILAEDDLNDDVYTIKIEGVNSPKETRSSKIRPVDAKKIQPRNLDDIAGNRYIYHSRHGKVIEKVLEAGHYVNEDGSRKNDGRLDKCHSGRSTPLQWGEISQMPSDCRCGNTDLHTKGDYKGYPKCKACFHKLPPNWTAHVIQHTDVGGTDIPWAPVPQPKDVGKTLYLNPITEKSMWEKPVLHDQRRSTAGSRRRSGTQSESRLRSNGTIGGESTTETIGEALTGSIATNAGLSETRRRSTRGRSSTIRPVASMQKRHTEALEPYRQAVLQAQQAEIAKNNSNIASLKSQNEELRNQLRVPEQARKVFTQESNDGFSLDKLWSVAATGAPQESRRRLTGSQVAASAPHRRLVVLEKLLEDIKSANRNRDH